MSCCHNKSRRMSPPAVNESQNEDRTHSTDKSKTRTRRTNKFKLRQEEVSSEFKIPFVLSGYRATNLKAVECIQSAFLPTCNETVNFWSHFVAFAFFVWKFHEIFTKEFSILDRDAWPLLCSAIGVCGFCLASSLAHLFNAMSPKAMETCFFMDYAAISVYTVGMGQACFMYSRPLHSSLFIFKTEWIFTVLSCLTAINATTLCCTTTFRWHQYKYVIRTAAFALPWIINSGPLIFRIFAGAESVSPVVLRSFSVHFVLYLLSGLFNAVRFPERLFPGAFDVFGHSHHFLHIFTAIGAYFQFNTFHWDWMDRKEALASQPIDASFYNTLLPFLLSFVITFGIALIFGSFCDSTDKPKEE